VRDVRIVGSRPPIPPVMEDLPDGVDEREPYAVRSPAPAATLPQITPPPSRDRAVTVGLIATSTVLVLMFGVVLALQRFGQADTGALPQPALNVAGRLGEDRVDCKQDLLMVSVTPGGSPSGIVIARLESSRKSLSLVLGAGVDGYNGAIYVANGVAATNPSMTGSKLSMFPGEALILRVDGLLEARRVFVDGRQNPFGPRGQLTC
jgi:hypothetical protein